MNHAAEGLLQAYLDDELIGEEKSSVVAHVGACAECSRQLAELKAADVIVGRALRMLGSAPADLVPATPVVTLDLDRARAARSGARHSMPQFGYGSLARAAAMVLLLAGGVAAVVPGSPVRRWVVRSAERIAALFTSEKPAAPAVTPATTTAAEKPFVAAEGLGIAPDNGQVRVLIWSAAAGSSVRVTFVDTPRPFVQYSEDAKEARFRSSRGRLEILDLGAGAAEVQLPRSLRSATIDVNGTQYLYKQGDSLRVTGPVVRRTADEIVFKTGS